MLVQNPVYEAVIAKLCPKPIHPLTGKAVRYAIPAGLNPKCFCVACGLLLNVDGVCEECGR